MSRTDVSRPTSEVSTRRSPRSDGLLALAGAGIFAASIVFLHFVEKEFEPCCRFISEYVLGDWGWLMNTAFIAMGGAFMAVAHGLRSSLSPGRRVTASVRLMYLVGITTVVSGLFNSDSIDDLNANRVSWHETVHDLAGFTGIIFMVVATLFLRGVFARDAQWRRFAPHALMFAIASVAMFVLVMAAPMDSFGVAQRAFVTVDVLWIGTLGCGLLGAEPALPSEQGRQLLGRVQRGR
jgi:Protein of unknown function (DUF998)